MEIFKILIYPTGLFPDKRQLNKWKEIAKIAIIVCLFPVVLLYGIILLLNANLQTRFRKKASTLKYTYSIVAIAKDESLYIEEWLAYHKIQGFQVVFLYDNESTDGMDKLLKPYIEDGFVIYNRIEGKHKQLAAYNDALVRYGKMTEYMAFIDCDEFILPLENRKMVDIIPGIFSRSKNIGGLGLNWCVYGSSGHVDKPSGLVIESYLYRSIPSYHDNSGIKSIVKPACVRRSFPHNCIYKKGFYCVSPDGKLVPSYYREISEYKGIRINHYFCKSKSEYIERRSRGQATSHIPKTIELFYKRDRNEIRDDVALKYAKDVKLMMEYYRGIK